RAARPAALRSCCILDRAVARPGVRGEVPRSRGKPAGIVGPMSGRAARASVMSGRAACAFHHRRCRRRSHRRARTVFCAASDRRVPCARLDAIAVLGPLRFGSSPRTTVSFHCRPDARQAKRATRFPQYVARAASRVIDASAARLARREAMRASSCAHRAPSHAFARSRIDRKKL
ncbi:hypothetical protein, partial [Burkholderia glumae]|uniref:hypothetical protein n=1 Tax=Burkholderia glumae TaxID=337 RepID=UPI0019D6E57F